MCQRRVNAWKISMHRDEQNPVKRLLKFLRGGISPELTLLENWLFRLAVLIPICSAGYLAYSNGLLVDTESKVGIYQILTNIWQDQKLIPLIAGLSFPFGAIAASHLRSLQASTQIQQQKEQNIFINHFKHLEEFTKTVEKTEFLANHKIKKTSNEIHSRIFPNSTDGNYRINPEIKIQLRICLGAIEKFCERTYRDGATETDVKLLYDLCKKSMEPIIGDHRVISTGVPVNKYDYSKTLCEKYLGLVNEVCEAASFYSRHSTLQIHEKCTETKREIEKSFEKYIREEKQIVSALLHHIGSLEAEVSSKSLDKERIFTCHTKLLHEIESKNLDPKLYYPYEKILEYYPALNERIIEFTRATGHGDAIRILDSKIHPQ